MKLSKQQLIIIGILAVILVILVIIGILVIYDLVTPLGVPVEAVTATEETKATATFTSGPDVSPSPSPTLPASPTVVSTFAPTSTPVVVASLTPIIKTPGDTSTKDTSTPIPEDSVCGIKLAEALAEHEEVIAGIDEVYLPQIADLQAQLDQAISDGETLTARRLTRNLEALQAEYDAATQEEVERYEIENHYIEFAYCR